MKGEIETIKAFLAYDPDFVDIGEKRADAREAVLDLEERIDSVLRACKLMEEGGEAFRIDYGCHESDPVVEVEDVLNALGEKR